MPSKTGLYQGDFVTKANAETYVLYNAPIISMVTTKRNHSCQGQSVILDCSQSNNHHNVVWSKINTQKSISHACPRVHHTLHTYIKSVYLHITCSVHGLAVDRVWGGWLQMGVDRSVCGVTVK